jgi:hypothetical protein
MGELEFTHLQSVQPSSPDFRVKEIEEYGTKRFVTTVERILQIDV